MKCSAGSYLTDLEIKPTPTLLALELINGCEQVAQRTSWLEVKKTPHLEPVTHHQYFQYITTTKTQNQCSYRNIFFPSSSPTAGDNGLTSDSQADVELVSLIKIVRYSAGLQKSLVSDLVLPVHFAIVSNTGFFISDTQEQTDCTTFKQLAHDSK